MTEETAGLSYLLPGSTLILALVGFYIVRALWIARREWAECGTDTKVLYLLVAPPLTLAVDLLEFTDRLFWSRRSRTLPQSRASHSSRRPLRPKTALRSDA